MSIICLANPGKIFWRWQCGYRHQHSFQDPTRCAAQRCLFSQPPATFVLFVWNVLAITPKANSGHMSLNIENALKHLHSKTCPILQQLSTVVNYTGLRRLFCTTVLFSALFFAGDPLATIRKSSPNFIFFESNITVRGWDLRCHVVKAKSCDFRLTERKCLCDSSGWTRLDDVTGHDNFFFYLFIICSLTYPNNGEDCFGAIF